jgi:hypothetical protein
MLLVIIGIVTAFTIAETENIHTSREIIEEYNEYSIKDPVNQQNLTSPIYNPNEKTIGTWDSAESNLGNSYIWDPFLKKMKIQTPNNTIGSFGPLTISEFVFYNPSAARPFGVRSYIPDYVESVCLASNN